MKRKHAKRGALAALLLSILCIGYAIFATVGTAPVFGPMTLVVAPDGALWMDVDGELWRATAEGQLIDRRRWQALGLPGAPANLLRHPDGGLVATVRRNSTLYRLDPQTGQVKGQLQPAWPADLQEHGGRAINLAFHPDGRFAVATGAGHTVALFDAQGAFMARTPPGTYRFTNGLWWAGESLWTTDTNRTQLKRLDGRTLALQQTMTLPPRGAMQYLGPARAQSEMPSGPPNAPSVGLIRFDNGMDRGTATLLAANGQETPLAEADNLLPRDLDWLNGQLVLSDGASFSIKRWTTRGEALAPFGDAGLQAALRAGLDQRERHQRQRHLAFGAAAACWLLAGLALWWGRGPAVEAAPSLDLSQLATPTLPISQLARLAWQLHWPAAPALLPIGLLKLHAAFGDDWAPHARNLFLAVACGLGALALIAMPALLRRYKRLSMEPQFEPLLNFKAVRRLRIDRALPGMLRQGERVLETWIMQSTRVRWVVMTDERLLVLAPGWAAYRLKTEAALGDITGISMQPGAMTISEKFKAARSRKAFRERLRPQAAWLEIALRNGQVLAGAVHSTPLAQRVAQRLAPKPGPL